jgi:hypothetical protein
MLSSSHFPLVTRWEMKRQNILWFFMVGQTPSQVLLICCLIVRAISYSLSCIFQQEFSWLYAVHLTWFSQLPEIWNFPLF